MGQRGDSAAHRKGQQCLASRNKRANTQQLKPPGCDVLPRLLQCSERLVSIPKDRRDPHWILSSLGQGCEVAAGPLLMALVSLGPGGSRSGHSGAQDHSSQHRAVPLLPAPAPLPPSLQDAHSSGSAARLRAEAPSKHPEGVHNLNLASWMTARCSCL